MNWLQEVLIPLSLILILIYFSLRYGFVIGARFAGREMIDDIEYSIFKRYYKRFSKELETDRIEKIILWIMGAKSK